MIQMDSLKRHRISWSKPLRAEDHQCLRSILEDKRSVKYEQLIQQWVLPSPRCLHSRPARFRSPLAASASSSRSWTGVRRWRRRASTCRRWPARPSTRRRCCSCPKAAPQVAGGRFCRRGQRGRRSSAASTARRFRTPGRPPTPTSPWRRERRRRRWLARKGPWPRVDKQ